MEFCDGKCFVDSCDEYSSVLRELFDRGQIPSFRNLFSHTRIARLSHEEKAGKDIIQFSFFVRGRNGRIMLVDRVDPGHIVTRGKSILVSWSPYLEKFSSEGHSKYGEEDILNIYARELLFPEVEEPFLRYVGFARNQLSGGRVYYFHVFEAIYDCPEEVLDGRMREVGERQVFVKDKEAFLGFFSVKEILGQGYVANPVDLSVLNFLKNRLISSLQREGENGSCRLIPWEGFFQGEGIPQFLFS